jgi:hypothetical protein
LAAEMTPATPAPGAAVQSDTKASVSGTGSATATGINGKVDSKLVPADKKVSKDASKDLKAAKDKAKPEQTAKLPASSVPAPSVPAPTPTVNGSTGTSVQH